MNFVLGI